MGKPAVVGRGPISIPAGPFMPDAIAQLVPDRRASCGSIWHRPHDGFSGHTRRRLVWNERNYPFDAKLSPRLAAFEQAL